MFSLSVSTLTGAQGIYELWGTTGFGGTEDAGTIFKTDGQANNFQFIHHFSASAGPRSPYGRLTFFDGKLYGTATTAGPASGVIYEIDPLTGIYTERLSRLTDVNGAPAGGTLIPFGNKLYGLGLAGNAGIIFEWDPVTNVFVKKVDLQDVFGKPNYFQILTQLGNKFYGTTTGGAGVNVRPTFFEWDPLSNNYTTKLDLDTVLTMDGRLGAGLAEKDGKLYGTLVGTGANFYGELFEWDPVTNVYTKQIDFNINSMGGTPGIEGASPFSGMVRMGDKFYGTALDGGYWGMGTLYEWDPLVNQPSPYDPIDGRYVVEHDFDAFFTPDNSGRNPNIKLTSFHNKIYGLSSHGGLNEKGIFFEFDPVTNVFTKKYDFPAISTISSDIGWGENGVIPVQVAIAPGTPSGCITVPAVTIDNSNNNQWVEIKDNQGRAVAEIRANGNNLGLVTTELYVHNATTREDAGQRMYLDRNITISPQIQPATAVDIRLYVSAAEFTSLSAALNSNGQPSGINTINDLGIFKNDDGCVGALAAGALPVTTTTEVWNGGYVLSGNIPAFSSFYFANSLNATLPLELISFTATLVGNDGVLNWKTTSEINTSHFEIERSVDGRNYQVIAKQNTFNSPGTHVYSYIDRGITSVGHMPVFYRLRQVDIDGRVTYSHVVILNLTNAPVFLFYPNPVVEQATIVFNTQTAEQVKLEVIDATGRMLRYSTSNIPPGRSNITLNLGDLPGGYYQLRVNGKSIHQHRSFLKK